MVGWAYITPTPARCSANGCQNVDLNSSLVGKRHFVSVVRARYSRISFGLIIDTWSSS
ncbi:hypothetical protein E4U21_001233 [Claviceps maximensis]|nr:hypothetical protein E4U21_001233 [Claviceps maximensis]